MRRMWQEILTNLTIPLVVGLLLAIASGKREDKRADKEHTTPTYGELMTSLDHAQDHTEELRKDLSTLRDERDALARSLSDWHDWGHQLVAFWEQRRMCSQPPHLPDEGSREEDA